jgi:hypothetical protein
VVNLAHELSPIFCRVTAAADRVEEFGREGIISLSDIFLCNRCKKILASGHNNVVLSMEYNGRRED